MAQTTTTVETATPVEVEPGQWGKLKFMAWDGVYHVASTRIGQRAFSLIDRILCILEAVNFLAAPKDQQEEARTHTKVIADERPLPWTLYMPVLFACHIVLKFVSVAAMLTKRKFTTIMAVYYIQSWRTTMKTIKIEGARISSDPQRRATMLPWPLRYVLNLLIWGPLQFVTIVTSLIVGNKLYNNYAVSATQPRSKRYLKKLRSTPASECTTLELLDKLADEDEQDDPDFELKSNNLVSGTDDEETVEEDDDDDEGEEAAAAANSDAEEDGQAQKNGSPKGGEDQNGQDNNHQSHGQHEENNHQEQHHHHHY